MATSSKGFGSDQRHPFRKNDLDHIHPVLERSSLGNRKASRSAVAKELACVNNGGSLKERTAAESIFPHRQNEGMDINPHKRHAAVKCVLADRPYRRGQSDPLERRATIKCASADRREPNHEANRFQRAAVKRVGADVLDPTWNNDTEDIGPVEKRVVRNCVTPLERELGIAGTNRGHTPSRAKVSVPTSSLCSLQSGEVSGALSRQGQLPQGWPARSPVLYPTSKIKETKKTSRSSEMRMLLVSLVGLLAGTLPSATSRACEAWKNGGANNSHRICRETVRIAFPQPPRTTFEIMMNFPK
jgi:hypothetical protein